MPAMAPAEAALRRSSSGISRRPVAYQPLARSASNLISSARLPFSAPWPSSSPGAGRRPALPQTALQRGDVGAGSVESRDLLLGRQGAVPDVVDPAREGVYGGQRPPLVAGQQGDAVGEVLGLLAGDPLALAVGSTDLSGHGLILVHEAHLPLAKALASSSTVRALPGRGLAGRPS